MHCQNSYVGHVLFPEKKENRLYFSYRACKFQKKIESSRKLKEEKSNLYKFDRMKDIDMNTGKVRYDKNE